MKQIILLAISLLSIMVFVASLCAIGSPSPLPYITLFASEAWIVLAMRHLDAKLNNK